VDIAIVFHGPINPPATIRLRNAICQTTNRGLDGNTATICTRLWLLMSSSGGSIEDGIGIYNLLRTIKCEVVTVNMGQIASIANVIFLGGGHRIACPDSYFYFHDVDWSFTSAHTMSRHHISETAKLLEIGKTNSKAILKSRTILTDADFKKLKLMDEPLIRDASFAKQKGIVQDICLPNLPTGTPIYNVDY
jgi:ATP-dependent protease ClpP protease subunit